MKGLLMRVKLLGLANDCAHTALLVSQSLNSFPNLLRFWYSVLSILSEANMPLCYISWEKNPLNSEIFQKKILLVTFSSCHYVVDSENIITKFNVVVKIIWKEDCQIYSATMLSILSMTIYSDDCT